MKNWWIKLGCFLTGYNYQIVKYSSEASAKAVKKYTSALLIVAILWGFIGFAFTDRYLHGNLAMSMFGAIVMIIIVIQIERQIILGVGRVIGPKIFRVVIGFVMAIIGSIVIDQIVFKDDIEKQQINNRQTEINELLPNKTKQLNEQILDLQFRIDSTQLELERIIHEVELQPFINSQSAQRQYIKDTSTGKWLAINKSVSNQSVPNPKSSFIPGLQNQIEMLTIQKLKKDSSIINVRDELEAEIRSKTGFLDELNILKSILLESKTALFVWGLWFIFLFAIELFVLVSKLWDTKNDYDQTILHQMELKLAVLEKLSREKGELIVKADQN